MRNIFHLIRDDLQRAFQNVVTIIIIVGLVVLPSLFSWYNILGCWDVFNHTNQLTIAVANTDEGYSSELMPIEVNIGDKVISALRENNDINWVFTDEADAIEGVKSGKYYAATVIPENFSRSMLTFYSEDAEHANIIYYSNEKKSAIAPKITDQASSRVANQVNETFVNVLTDVSLTLANSLDNYLISSDAAGTLGNMADHLTQVGSQLKTGGSTLSTYATTLGSASDLVNSSTALLGNTMTSIDGIKEKAAQSKSSSSEISNTVAQANSALKLALQKTRESYKDASNVIIEAFDQASALSGQSSSSLREQAENASSSAENFMQLAASIRALESTVPAEYQQTLEKLALQMESTAATEKQLSEALVQGADSIDSQSADTQANRDKIVALAQQSQASIDDLNAYYASNVEPTINELADKVSKAADSLKGNASSLRSSTDDLMTGSTSVAGKLKAAQNKLILASGGLANTGNELSDLGTKIKDALALGDTTALKNILTSDTESLAALISAPVEVQRNAVFPAENFGSQMAPLYSTLGLWIGALLAVVAIKPVVSKRAKEKLDNPKPRHLYFGRFGIFGAVAFCQSTIMALGNLLFLGVQVSDPLLFFVAYWVASEVFMFIMYTCVVSFANLGKAIGVLLLILQVTAAGGSFPLQMLPPIFGKLSPFIPATHCINAMREAMFGVYGNHFWMEIGELALFIIPMLLLGLALRKPLAKFLNWYVEKAEESKLIQ